LKPREVAHLFNVEISTVVEWARTGKIPALKTPGGQQYRFDLTVVMALLEPIVVTDSKGGKDWTDPATQTRESA
jgi:excisionase family DNA binding protein